MDEPKPQIVVRHVTGARINKIDQFQLDAIKEITFGRDARSTIPFDSPQDNLVSRKHAVIRIKSEDPLAFAIEDLNTSNGTFVNGERIIGEAEIAPDDKVVLGAGGPEFVFDVQPRPASLASRTRGLSTIETMATRVVAAAGATSPATAQATTQKLPPKMGTGENTAMMMPSDERKRTSQAWMGGMAAVIAFVLVGVGALYWHNASTAERLQQEADDARQKMALAQEQIRQNASNTVSTQIKSVTQQLEMSPGDITSKYGNSMVFIAVSWRLYDKSTGRPVFHKKWTHEDKKAKTVTTLPAYVQLLDYGTKIYPWFTTDDEENKNYKIGGSHTGSGFVINENGFIVTNKHVAESWMIRTPPSDYLGTNKGFLISVSTKGKKKEYKLKIIDVDEEAPELQTWIPGESGGILWQSKGVNRTNLAQYFHGRDPTTPSNRATFFGKDEILEVRFRGSRLSMNAVNVRHSTDADAALIKIESPQPLTPIDIASDDVVKPGEKIIVMGYPGVSDETYVNFETQELGLTKARKEVIPELTITDGIISRLPPDSKTADADQRVTSSFHNDALQLSVNATGAGNSGGPVFNAAGKAIGIYTYGRERAGARVSFAVPIKHARALLTSQRAGQ